MMRPFVDANGLDCSDGINGSQASRQWRLLVPGHFDGGVWAQTIMQARSPILGLSCRGF